MSDNVIHCTRTALREICDVRGFETGFLRVTAGDIRASPVRQLLVQIRGKTHILVQTSDLILFIITNIT